MSANYQEPKILLHGVPDDLSLESLKKQGAKDAFVMEGRPHLKAAKFLCSKLLRKKITPVLISDNMAGFLFFNGLVKETWISYQSFNKKGAFCDIGALILGVLGKKHKVPVYLFRSQREIEAMGDQKDIMYFNAKRTAPQGIKGFVPLVEWVPKRYITGVKP